MSRDFWLGIAVTVIGGLLAGILLQFLIPQFEKRPDLSWFRVATFDLPPEYLTEFRIDIERELTEADYARVGNASRQELIIVENRGAASARSVRVEVPGYPVSVQINARQRANRQLQPDGRMEVILDAIEPSEQALLVVSGGSSDLLIVHDGETVRQRIGSHLSIGNGDTTITISSLILYSLLCASFLSATVALYQLLPASTKGKAGRPRAEEGEE